jgi:hypothetical protein
LHPTGESEPAANRVPPAIHLTADAGVQAYKEPYPRIESDGSHRSAFIPGRAVVHVAATRGAWAQVSIDDEIVGWVEGSHLIPPIGTRIAPSPRNPTPSAGATNQTTINVDTLVAALAGIGIIMSAVLDWTQGVAVNSFKIPLTFLFDPNTTTRNPRLGYFVIALGVVGVFLGFVRNARGLRGLVGLAALAIAVLFCGQIAVQLSDAHSNASFTDIVGAGPWLTGIAGIALVVSAFLSPEI